MSILPTMDPMWDEIPHDAYVPGLLGMLTGRRQPMSVIGEDAPQDGEDLQPPDFTIPIPGQSQQGSAPPYLNPRMGMTPKQPGKFRRVLGGLGGVLSSVADAVGTPNIAGGGPVDIARSFSAAQKGNRERDIAAYNMRRQLELDAEQRANNQEMRQYRQAQAGREKALADYYLRRASGPQPKPVRTGFDKLGNLLNMETGELLRQADPKQAGPTMPLGVGQFGEIGGYEPASAVNPSVSAPGVDPVDVPGSMSPVQFPAYGRMLDVTPEEFSKLMNSDTMRQNATRPRTSLITGSDASGQQLVSQVVQTPEGPKVMQVATGAMTRAPRQAGGGGGSARPRELTAAGKVAIEARKNRAIDMANKDLLTGKGTEDLWRTRLQNAQISYENELKAAGFQVQHDDWYKRATPPRRGPAMPGAPQTAGPAAPPKPSVPTLRNPGPAPSGTEVQYKNGIPYVYDRNVKMWIPQISTVK